MRVFIARDSNIGTGTSTTVSQRKYSNAYLQSPKSTMQALQKRPP